MISAGCTGASMGKTLSRTCRARLEFQPEYPRNTTSAFRE
uniref:Uncharacterized protein MANES_08G092200 n=1 Tax=Rhizophora mucronata TaxID=61149 RepID=A0A2P2ILU5_RHIMU